MAELLDEDFRKVGMTGLARIYPQTPGETRMFAAWLGVDPDKMNPAMKYWANETTKTCWGRAKAAVEQFHNWNPPTICVPIIPIRGKLLVVRRALPGFGFGKICFPGGFQESGDSWQRTLSKETSEETGVETDENLWTLSTMVSVEDNTKNLLFAVYDQDAANQLDVDFSFTSKETSEVLLWDGTNTDWAFVVHEHQANLWMENR